MQQRTYSRHGGQAFLVGVLVHLKRTGVPFESYHSCKLQGTPLTIMALPGPKQHSAQQLAQILIRIPTFCGIGYNVSINAIHTTIDVDFFIRAVELAYENPMGVSAEELDGDETRIMVLISHLAGEALDHLPTLPQDTRTSWAKLTAALRKRYGMYLLCLTQTDPGLT